MTTKAKIWFISSVFFFFFVLVGTATSTILGLPGGRSWIVRGALAGVGFAAAAVLHRILSIRWGGGKKEEKKEEKEDRIGEAFSEAKKKLSASRFAETARFGKLPLALVLGPSGSAKTSVVLHSGLDPELLAGDVYREGTVVPTEGVNVWYARETLFVEAGGRLLGDTDGWSRLSKELRPSRLAAVLARGSQSPRAAVVCYSAESFFEPGAGESVPAAARRLRERLQETSGELGLRLPVYVIFTKADRIPYFEDFVRSLSMEEAREALGATLRYSESGTGSEYAEGEARRVGGAFDELFRSLSLRRPRQLARESDDEVKAGVYEFPREFHKARDLLVRFLVELCRPSQLAVSPFLRGFYFTGVRPVVVEDDAAEARPGREAAPDAAGGSVGATMVFDPEALKPKAPQRQPTEGGRRVPQWTFLERVLPEAILGDRVARAITGEGSRVRTLRRTVAGAGVALAVLAGVALTVSFFGNRGLERDALTAVEAAEALESTGGSRPTADALRTLDSLGSVTERLAERERDGRPLRLQWGLYTGDDLLPHLRDVYFDRFDRLLGRPARDAVAAYLRSLPPRPTAAYGFDPTYDALKAYLVTTRYPERSEPAFVADVLTRHWARAYDLPPELEDLVRDQFRFYGEELRHAPPVRAFASDSLLIRTRSFLRQFKSADWSYRNLIATANDSVPAVRFSREFPGSESAMRVDVEVPGAYTDRGWTYVHESLANVGRVLQPEEWVIGGQTFTEEELERLASTLEERYVADYIDRWSSFLSEARVVPFGGPDAGARRLAHLADNQSPLLQLLALTSRHTRVDSATVGEAFQPVHVVMPPEVTDRYVVEANQSYMDALGGLQAALEEVAGASGSGRSRALGAASDAANAVQAETRRLAQNFRIEGAAGRVGEAVRELLEAPSGYVDRVVATLPAAEVNSAGRSFCRRFDELASRYPFERGASRGAAVEGVDAILKPGGSALWSFYEDRLRDLLSEQGSRYAARPNASPRPTSAFVRFFNDAAAASEALYDSPDAPGPAVRFALRLEATEALPEVTIHVDGQVGTFTERNVAQKTLRWEAARAENAYITGVVGGREVTLLEAPTGTWALFRLFERASWEQRAPGEYRLHWPIPGQQLTLRGELLLQSRVPILNPGWLSGLDCVSTIAR